MDYRTAKAAVEAFDARQFDMLMKHESLANILLKMKRAQEGRPLDGSADEDAAELRAFVPSATPAEET